MDARASVASFAISKISPHQEITGDNFLVHEYEDISELNRAHDVRVQRCEFCDKQNLATPKKYTRYFLGA